MTRPAVVAADAERIVVDLLTGLLGAATVSVGVPIGWTPSTSPPHLSVSLDGTPSLTWPVATSPTVRLLARAGSTTDAKALANLAQGVLCSLAATGAFVVAQPLTGVLPARDSETDAELAAVTCRVTVRSTPIT